MIWVFISSVLFQCHDKKAYGAKYTTVEGDLTVRLSMLGFVDDSSCISNTADANDSSLSGLVTRLQHDTQLWNDLLWVSGGKLELPKCSFHVMHFEFRPDGQPFLVDSIEQQMVLKDAEGNQVPITYKSVRSTHKTLGHLKAPYGDNIAQTESLVATGRALATAIFRSPATPLEAKLFYDTIVIPKLGYPLPQSHLSSKQLRAVQTSVLPLVLSKSGFNRNTHRAVIHGPCEYGGAGFVPLSVHAGVGQILHFIRLWRSPHLVEGKFLQIVTRAVQRQAGISNFILQDTTTRLPQVEAKWLMALRSFLASIDGTIVVHEKVNPVPNRKSDVNLMDYVCQTHQVTDLQIRRFNYCRLYLGITWLSEICDVTGTRILPQFLDGARPPHAFKPVTSDIKQSCPS
jgi:hypothetical protein